MESHYEEDLLRRNYGYLIIGILVAFLILLGKIWYLQLIKGVEFQDASDTNRMREKRLAAPRGIIKDRDDRILVDNRPSYDVYFHPMAIKGRTRDESRSLRLQYLERISTELDVDFSLIKRRFNQVNGISPIKIKTDISWEEVAQIKIQEMSYSGDFPLTIDDETKRFYPYKELGAHLLGYIAEISPKTLLQPEYENYRPGDMVGKMGVEDAFESYLKGSFGRKEVEENARSVEIRTLDITPPVAGDNLDLNIDFDLMETAAKAMGEMAGAVVALDVNTGAVLCLLSMPGYNPEVFSRVLPKDLWDQLRNDPKKPLTNKAISNAYPPGSTWKVVTAIAALETDTITGKWMTNCAGKWKYGDREFRCWSKFGHGAVNLHKALKSSCDVFFYKVGLKTGIDEIAHWAHELGAGEKTGIDITPETKGTIPTRAWKLEKLGSKWIAGETLSCAIGQGYNLVSPIQLAQIYATIANGGTVYRPQVVARVRDADGLVVEEFKPEVVHRVEFKHDYTLPLVRQGLLAVVNEQGGTGASAKLKNYLVAGKTGTAQVKRIRAIRHHISVMEYQHRDHAWFAAYAPYEKPEIAVAVLCEHSGHGGSTSAPVARAVLAKYFRKKERSAPNPALDKQVDEETLPVVPAVGANIGD